MINSEHANLVQCTTCSWRRILDPLAEYRGGHPNPVSGSECHGVLEYGEIAPRPIAELLLDRPHDFETLTPHEKNAVLDAEKPLLESIYEARGNQVDDLISRIAVQHQRKPMVEKVYETLELFPGEIEK
jgi:hypothetical protein